MKFSTRRSGEKAELQLTSMIDVIFLLLIFFVSTFKIVAQEGDFNIRMPLGGGAGSAENTNVPIKVRLRANSAGELSDLVVNDNLTFMVQSVDGEDIEAKLKREKQIFGGLRGFILQLTNGVAPPSPDEGPEVEIDLDYGLQYGYVIQAVTAVTGQRQGDEVTRLVERIKFAAPRKPQ